MNYSELKEIFWELKRNSPNDNLTAHIIFTDGSFAKEYPLLSRTYRFSSDNKAFWPSMGGYSIFAYCLDKTSDQGVRLDWYMEDEGNSGGWKVEDCYILEQMRDADTMSDLIQIELEDDTVCYCFGGTCIRVCETTVDGKVRLEPLAGNQMIDGKWIDLPIDRVYGYCTLLEQHLNGEVMA